MNKEVIRVKIKLAAVATIFVLAFAHPGLAKIETVKGPSFNLETNTGYVVTPDGGSYLMWGYAESGKLMQYPGPTLDVNEGDTVTINLTNNLNVPVSIVFPGQKDVVAVGDSNGLLTKEADPNGGTAQYTFVASHPGTYMYHSGTDPAIQIEMGLVGALIIRPNSQPPDEKWAYNYSDSSYDYEILFLLTEMDPRIHQHIEFVKCNMVDLTDYKPVLWFINGRNFPDTLLPANYPLLPYQPYNCLPRMHPGEKILMRLIGAGRDLHPFHPHGNNFIVIARDGRLLSSGPGKGADLAYSDYTLSTAPGATYDATFTWTGKGLGWDIYGHDVNDLLEPNEYEPDHGKPFPVILPAQKDLTIGAAYSGSPFLGAMGSLPPGEGGLNINGGYFYPWHSHSEKEIVNNDIFIGGMLTLLIIEPPHVPIE